MAQEQSRKEGKRTPRKAKGATQLKPPQSIERLRDRIQQAAQELERLRSENAKLAARVEELETRPAIDVDGTVLTFDDDPGALREKIEAFIEAIDAYLAAENE